MADYYPLIARAVNDLVSSTAETRAATFNRARAAMLAQLRSVTPALSESDINREHLALEEAIKKVETETPRQSDNSPRLSLSQPPEPPPSVVRPQYIGPPTAVVRHF